MSKPKTTTSFVALIAALACSLYALAGPGDAPVPFPKGYRKWAQ